MEPIDASKVKCTGPGVGNSIPASLPTTFTVDATKAGKAPLEVEVEGPKGVKVPVDIVNNGDGTFDCSYTPEKKGKLCSHIIDIHSSRGQWTLFCGSLDSLHTDSLKT